MRRTRQFRKNATDLLVCITLAFIFVMLSTGAVFSQGNVGINNSTPHAKSLLDLTSNDKGLLAPRMTAAQRTAMFPVADATAKGMLVYQTDGTQGFYYYDGVAWVTVQTGNAGWSLTGNAGTDPANDFVGTTDNQSLIMRTNNVERMRVSHTGNISVGAAVDPVTYRLYVENDNYSPGLLLRNMNATGYSGIHMLNELNTGRAHIGFGNAAAPNWANMGYAGTTTAHPFVFTTNDVERMRIDAGGNVGIGMVPLYNLDLYAPNQAVARLNSGNAVNGTVLELKNSSVGDNNLGAINFNNAANTYAGQLSYHTTNGMTFRSGGAERMRVAADGNVGIGTTTPGRKLDVVDADAGLVARFQGTNNNGYSIVHWLRSDNVGAHIGFFNPGIALPLAGNFVMGTFGNAPVSLTVNNAERMHLAANGNVGVGTAAPSARLHVVADQAAGMAMTVQNTSATGWSGTDYRSNTGAGNATVGYDNNTQNGFFGTTTNHPVTFISNWAERMRLTEAGNLGIGTAAPGLKLMVVNNTTSAGVGVMNQNTAGWSGYLAADEANTGHNVLGFGNSGHSFAGSGFVGTTTNHPLVLLSGNTERMRITSAGNVGIGMAPAYNLDVHANDQAVARFNSGNAANGTVIELKNSTAGDNNLGAINFNNGANGYPGQLSYHATNGMTLRSGGTERMRIAANGNVGIGTSAPTTKLEVNGFTKLGNDAPAIKVKKLTGTTAATEGGVVDIAHGLTASKILGIQVLIEYSTGNWLGEAYTQSPEYQAHALVMAANIRILNHGTNSGNILSRPVKILVTYEE